MARTDPALQSIDALLTLGQHVLGIPAAIRASIAGGVAAEIEGRVDRRLRDMPVESLRDALPRGARLGGLARSPWRTVADVATVAPQMLATVPGVGPQSAAAVHREAVAQQQRVRAEVRYRLDVEVRGAADTAILMSLLTLRLVEPAVEKARGPLAALRTQVDPLRDPARRANSALSMFFAGRVKRQQATWAVAQLRGITADPRLASLHSYLTALAYSPPVFADPWSEYERDAAAVNALLSQFVAIGSDEEARSAHGYLTREYVDEADRTSLDRTYLRSSLRGYQSFGAQYLLTRRKAILGDEMGLGKTVQALAVAAHLAAEDKPHTLVVCPASVVRNWMNETAKHTELVPWQVHGDDRELQFGRWAGAGGVAVTTFDTLKMLRVPVVPDLLIVDEAHYIKNPLAQRTLAVREVVDSAGRAVLLTGTPMENRVSEFKNLVEYLQPTVAKRIHVRDGLAGSTSFRKTVAPVYLRRNQVDVLTELPELIEVEDWVLFNGEDAAAYRSSVGSGNFMAMRRAAYEPGTRAGSAKLDRLVEVVEEAEENGAKVLVFSFFRGVLDTVRNALPGTLFGPITGSTGTAERQRLVDEFTAHQGSAVLLSQIEAGGVGLNIQAASMVILTEPQWKPSTEAQAIARAHRMGQVRTVQVHRLLAKESVDELMRSVLAKKSDLFDEYARRSHAKESDTASVNTSWDTGVGATERDFVRVEQQRLRVGPSNSE
ncbi:DEAD/DEAH box helicase [Rhodococcus sp. NPDC004095]